MFNKRLELTTEDDVVKKEKISACLKTDIIGKNLYLYKIIDSTNTKALSERLSGAIEGSVFIAEHQTSGKGRLGRNWIANDNKNILMSILIYPDIKLADISKLTLIAGLSVCKVIINELGLNAYLKWPNDIIINNKKVCGILINSKISNESVEGLAIGIGINVNSKYLPMEIEKKATSLAIESQSLLDRSKIITLILERFEKDYLIFLNNPVIPAEYKRLSCTLQKEISFYKHGTKITALAKDIAPSGNLVVQSKDKEYEIGSGEISIQDIY